MDITEVYRMPIEVACEMIRTAIEPGEQPLGIPFGWQQPASGDWVNLGTAYCTIELNVDDVIEHLNGILDEDLAEDRLYDPFEKGIDKETYDELVAVVRKDAKLHGYDHYNGRLWTPGVYLEAEVVSYPFNDLDDEEKALLRLAILCMNTIGTDGHQFASSYVESLAQYKCEYVNAKAEWTVSDINDRDNTKEYIERLLDLEVPYRRCYGDSFERDVEMPDFSQRIYDWIEECWNDLEAEYDPLSTLFTFLKDDWHDIKRVLAYCIQWFQEAYEDDEINFDVIHAPPIVQEFLNNMAAMHEPLSDQLVLFDVSELERSVPYQNGYRFSKSRTLKDSPDYSKRFKPTMECVNHMDEFHSPWEAREWLDGAQDAMAEAGSYWWKEEEHA